MTRWTAWLRGVTLAGVILGLAWSVWWVRRPVPIVTPWRPAVPSVSQVRGEPVEVMLPDAVFRASPSAAPAGPVAVETAGSWKLLGIELGPPAAAFLKDAHSGQTVWVKEGDRLGDWVIKQIQSGRVMLEGAHGDSELRL